MLVKIMMSTDIDNQRYLELAEMVLLLGQSKDNTIYEKHKFMSMLFFLKHPLFLEKLVEIHKPRKTKNIKFQTYEKYGLLYEESRVSVISPKLNHLLSYLLSREMITTEFSEKGFMFRLKEPRGIELFNELRKTGKFKEVNIRAKTINAILGSKNFDEIKQVILKDFRELRI